MLTGEETCAFVEFDRRCCVDVLSWAAASSIQGVYERLLTMTIFYYFLFFYKMNNKMNNPGLIFASTR